MVERQVCYFDIGVFILEVTAVFIDCWELLNERRGSSGFQLRITWSISDTLLKYLMILWSTCRASLDLRKYLLLLMLEILGLNSRSLSAVIVTYF